MVVLSYLALVSASCSCALCRCSALSTSWANLSRHSLSQPLHNTTQNRQSSQDPTPLDRVRAEYHHSEPFRAVHPSPFFGWPCICVSSVCVLHVWCVCAVPLVVSELLLAVP